MFAQVYLVYFLILGAKIGAVLGLPLGAVGALVAWLVGCPPSSRARSVFVLGVGMVGAVAMGIFEFQYLATGGVWMTLSFTLGGLIGGVVGAKLWLRLWAATCSGEVPEPA